MPPETLRRRRGTPAPSISPSSTTEVTSASTEPTSSEEQPQAPTKSISEVLEAEISAMKNFLGLTAILCLFFLFMIQATDLPVARRVQAVMIDAGSTGTRAQVFFFRHDLERNRLVLYDTKIITAKKSIAALASDKPNLGLPFFKPLLDKVKKTVPGLKRRMRTPIALRATAGLRLLGTARAEKALAEARDALRASEFLFEDQWVSLLSESEEADYAWTTVNYLLGNLDSEKNSTDAQFAGVLELGGASMQVVFEQKDIDEEGEENHSEEDSKSNAFSETTSQITLFRKSYKLHSRSYLGLGLFDFTKKLYLVFDREGVLEEGNPCFRKDKIFEKKRLRFGVPGSEETRVVTMKGDGNFERCVTSAEITIASFSRMIEKRSKLPLGTTFYAFAYFYDRTVKMGLPSSPTQQQMVEKGKLLCEAHPDMDVAGDFDEACAEFSYIYALIKILTDDFSDEHKMNIHFEQFVDGHMLGWALGAVLDTIQPVMHLQLSSDMESPFLS